MNTESKDAITLPPTSNDPKLKLMVQKMSNIGEMDPPEGFKLDGEDDDESNTDQVPVDEEEKVPHQEQS